MARPPPPKIPVKYFSGNYYAKFARFSGKNRVEFGNFGNFSGKYKKFGYFDNFSGKSHLKFGRFVNFYTYFRAKNVLPPKVEVD